MKKRTNFLRGGALALATMFLFATVVVQPIQANAFVKQVLCGALNLTVSASYAALDLSVAAMNVAFKLQIDLLEAAWKVQDQAIELHRSLSEAAFNALLAVYGAVTAWTTAEKAAIQSYKTTMGNALTVFRTKIDATRAAYREDMLALVKAHQKALAGLVNVAVTTIKTALNEAKQNCGKLGTIAKMVVVVAAAQVKLGVQAVAQEVTDLLKSTKLILTRNQGYGDAFGEYGKTKFNATIALIKATLGWKKETAAAQADLDATPAQ